MRESKPEEVVTECGVSDEKSDELPPRIGFHVGNSDSVGKKAKRR